MARLKVHKIPEGNLLIGGLLDCGIKFHLFTRVSTNWRNVTCARCLRMKPKGRKS